MSKIEVQKIVIQIGKKEVSLTIGEAKELQKILDETFGKKEIVYIPSHPVVIERPIYPPYRWWQVRYEDKSSTVLCSSQGQ